MEYYIRKVTEEDKGAVINIYNYFIENSFTTYQEKPLDQSFFEALKDIAIGGAFYVADTSNKEVVGFALLKKYQNVECFKRAAEVSYFILPKHTGKGLGTKLFTHLIDDARLRGIDTLVASVSSLNEESLEFHKRIGFTECGRLTKVGKKMGMDFDVVWMQKFI
jgi:L-amino acid N-acyltransferase YncA